MIKITVTITSANKTQILGAQIDDLKDAGKILTALKASTLKSVKKLDKIYREAKNA